jgi:hypothetical protein
MLSNPEDLWQALRQMTRFVLGFGILKSSFVVLLIFLNSCAYRVARQELKLVGADSEIRSYTVAIPVFDNKSSRTSGAESVVTDAFRSRWSRISNVRIVSSGSELFLLGRIKEWSLNGGRDLFTGTAVTEAYGGLAELQSSVANLILKIELEVELVREVDGAHQVVWSKTLRGTKSFEAYNRLDEASGSSSAPMIHESRERLALRRLAEDLANSSIDSFRENF